MLSDSRSRAGLLRMRPYTITSRSREWYSSTCAHRTKSELRSRGREGRRGGASIPGPARHLVCRTHHFYNLVPAHMQAVKDDERKC